MSAVDFPVATAPGERFKAPNGDAFEWSGQFWYGVDDGPTQIIGLFVDAAGYDIPENVTMVYTIGFHRPGLGAASYREAEILPPFNGGFATNAGTRFWELVVDDDYCITKFGADGDSNFVSYTGTNNTPAVNDAIDYVAQLPGGGCVSVPPTGIFACDNAFRPDPDGGLQEGGIWLKSFVRLQGTGGWIVRYASPDPLATRFHLIRLEDVQHCKVIGLNLDGSFQAQGGKIGSHMIRSHNAHHVQISFNLLRNGMGYGIASDVDIDDIQITFNTILENLGDCIDFHNTGLLNEGAIVGWNVCKGFAHKGTGGVPKAGIHGRGAGLLVIGNQVSACYGVISNIYGILLGNGEDQSGQQAIGNTVTMGTDCVNCKGFGSNNPNTLFSGNTCFGDTGTLRGFSIRKGNTTLTGNFCIPVLGKTVACLGDGFNIAVDALNVSVVGNVSVGNTGSGFVDDGTGTKFTNNQSNDNGRYGYDCVTSTGAILDFMNTGTNNVRGLLNRGPGTVYNQATDLNSVPSFPTLIIRNQPVGPTDAVPLSYIDTLLAGAFVPFQSGLKSNIITGDTAEHTFMIGTLPVSKIITAGAMGRNGNLIVKFQAAGQGTLGQKSFRVRLGPIGAGGAIFAGYNLNAINIGVRFYCDIYGQDSLTSQKSFASNLPGFQPYGAGNFSDVGAVNMNVDQPLYITGQLENGGDQMWLDAFSMRLVAAPPLPPH